MEIKASNGKKYDVSKAPPGGEHVVKLGGEIVGKFVIEPDTTRVTQSTPKASEGLLVEIADKFVDAGGGPVGML